MVLRYFFSVFGVYLLVHKIGNEQRGETTCHDHPEEVDVADSLLYVASHEAWQHHAQSHESRADGIMRGS